MPSRLRRLPRVCGGLRGWQRYACATAAGAATALSQAPYSLPLFVFLAWPVLVWLVNGAESARAGAVVGLAAGSGFFLVSLSWIVEPFMVDAARDGWMAPFAIALLAFGLALFWAAPFALARRVWPGIGSGLVILAGTMALGEYARAHLFTGFPWSMIAYGWSASPVLQTVSVFGPYALGFLTLFAAGLPAMMRPVPFLAAVALLGAGWSFGMQRLALPVPERPDGFTVRIVQPNAEQHLKWRSDMQRTFFRRQLDLSAAEGPRDAVIWTEAAVPFFLEDRPDLRLAMVAAAQAPVIVGARQVVWHGEQRNWYNVLSLLNEEGEIAATYQKSHLAPFGEYMPFPALFRGTGIEALAARATGGFSAGPGPHLVQDSEVPPFLPLICYEAIFPHAIFAPEGRPDWLVLVTNDAWFGTFSGPYQHLAQARSRAIEQGLPMARAANTGISAMIDPLGRVTASLGLGEAGKVDAVLPASLPPPLYARLGDPPIIALILLCALLPVTSHLFARRGGRET
ncbi:MAG: apolipoprotein N-acyltransferase [Paracoccaceae bacterium]